MTPCRNGHGIRYRFRTRLGHLRCEQCLAAARERWVKKQRRVNGVQVDSPGAPRFTPSQRYWRAVLRGYGVAVSP